MHLPFPPNWDFRIIIIDEAKEQISEQDESFEDVLTSLEQSRVTIEKERAEIARYKEAGRRTEKIPAGKRQEKLDERTRTHLTRSQ